MKIRVPILAIFVFIVVVAVIVAAYVGHIEDQQNAAQKKLIAVCRATATANTNFNKALDAILTNSLASSTLTQAQKAERVQQYGPLHLAVVSCP